MVKLDKPRSSFSSHNYDQDEKKEILYPTKALVADVMSEDLSLVGSVGACRDIFESCDHLKANGECLNSINHK